MLISHCTKIGKRKTNEDELYFNTYDNLYMIFDGHGGNICSRYLAQICPDLVEDLNLRFSKSEATNLFEIIQQLLIRKFGSKLNRVGSTALICMINNGYLNVINLGDCRCIICNNNNPIQITIDHKPNKATEVKRIEYLDGEVYKDDGDDWRVNCLSVSRAFGDLEANPEVSHVPDTYSRRISPRDQFILMACDGLWDVMTNLQVCNFVLDVLKIKVNVKDIASHLADYAIKKGSTDNISIIIIFL